MSFLADPLLLLATGAVIEQAVPDARTARRVEQATIVTFLAFSVPVYLEARWTAPIWKTFRARSGRDFMLNSGLLHFEHQVPRTSTHVVAALIFATYPGWLHLGRVLVRRRRAGQSP